MNELDDLKAKMQERLELFCEVHPALRDPAPPVPLRARDTAMVKPTRAWKRLVRRWRMGDYRLPIAESLDGLCGPFDGVGECLTPISKPGSVKWFDPARPARDGDFVLVQFDPDILAHIIRFNADDPRWRATYGEQPDGIAVKFLKASGPDYWLCNNHDAVPLANGRILGVLRHYEAAA